eukprot:TRINITY_DN5255_c0_g1_i1.p5 TRINITY_DN5255_c0_g1~~TRINITY_DN5255_c0_g1_i1.p5  ORF type:complete len:127 (-),score=25.19 TRINITY_DN5255_c0_g1_i1:591-944(-)
MMPIGGESLPVVMADMHAAGAPPAQLPSPPPLNMDSDGAAGVSVPHQTVEGVSMVPMGYSQDQYGCAVAVTSEGPNVGISEEDFHNAVQMAQAAEVPARQLSSLAPALSHLLVAAGV